MKYNTIGQELRRAGQGTVCDHVDTESIAFGPSSKKYIVDITREELTEEHVEITKNIYETIWKNSEPTYFGPDIHPSIEFSHFELIPIDQTVSQIHRTGGRVKDGAAQIVHRSLAKGYKLTNLPPAVLRVGSTDHWLTGDTRKEYFGKVGRNWILVAVFRPKASATKFDIDDAVSVMGQVLQPINASNPNTVEDVKAALSRQCEVWKSSNGTAGVSPYDLDALIKRVSVIGSRFSDTPRYNIAYGVYNNYNPTSVVASWSSDVKAAFRIESYMRNFKLQDSEKIIYMCKAASTVSKVFTSALSVAAANPEKEIRVVFHTSTLTGGDPESSYHNVAVSNIDKFEQMITNANIVTKGCISNIKVYGFLPAVGSIHSFNEPVLYNPTSRTLYQRKSEYMFDMDATETS